MQRLLLVTLGCFWLFMTWQLWRVEYAGEKLGAAVEISTVWDKIRRAPDDSHLQIVHVPSGQLFGELDWEPQVLTENTSRVEGQIMHIDSYELEVDNGVFLLDDDQGQVRFNLELAMDAASVWQTVRIDIRKLDDQSKLDLYLSAFASASNQVLNLSLELQNYTNQIQMPLEDMRDPRKFSKALLALRGTGKLTTITTIFAINKLLDEANLGSQLNFSFELPRKAHLDRLPGVRSDIKVYRVDFEPLKGWPASVYLNRTGEIMLVRLPQGYELRNTHYYGVARRRKQ
ncbi:MAG: hypothetical protein OSB29_00720 [Verrucomicrobiota bacterium]|nr:hypothetical protein [Verrucomicrobiota bacterium]